jgi:cyclopropane-fatty-acyl-phospholipid synthase
LYCTKLRKLVNYDTFPNMSESERIIKMLLSKAGIAINGRNPWDIQINDERSYDRFLKDRSLGFGEAYMDGWWDAAELDETIAKIARAHIEDELHVNRKLVLYALRKKMFNDADKNHAFTVAEKHYDIGNELYEAMLDPDLNYSCGYWKNLGNPETAWKIPRNLIKAQQTKLEITCKKLYLRKGQKILDIGCGWGNFAKYAATHFSVKVVGITISKQQALLAKKRTKGLPVKIIMQDYRELGEQQFDKIVSMGMFEHVTHKNYDTFMRKTASVLKKDGLFLLHTIGSNKTTIANDPWIEKYIFPNSHIPSMTQISKAVEDIFVIEDVHNFGVYYYPTLMAWFRNFNKNWRKLAATNLEKYNERFYRMWKFYLLSSAGFFKAHALQLWQIVLSKKNTLEIYNSVR